MVVAKWMVAFVALYCFGGLVADAIVPSTARMHIKNPAWPPHAKFHNGQTMMLGVLLGSFALGILFGVRPLTVPWIMVASGIASLYWLALLAASLFPGTAWVDPEFRNEVGRPLGLAPQQLLSFVFLLMLAVAVTLALHSA